LVLTVDEAKGSRPSAATGPVAAKSSRVESVPKAERRRDSLDRKGEYEAYTLDNAAAEAVPASTLLLEFDTRIASARWRYVLICWSPPGRSEDKGMGDWPDKGQKDRSWALAAVSAEPLLSVEAVTQLLTA
jgi:hypothetical protein